jgi:hypothetical protein
MKRLLLCICIFLSLIPLVLWGQTKLNKQSRGQKEAGYISLLTADSIKYWDCVIGSWGVALQKQGLEYMEYDEGRHREYVTRACMWLSTFFSVDQRRTLKVFRYSSRYPAELDWKGKILKLTEDTLIVKRKGVRGRTIYIKSKDQSSPLKPALNPYNRRTADYGVSVDSLLEMAYSLYCTYREKKACPDTMLLLVKLKLNEEGKVVMAKYKCTPPDSATYADFYDVFLSFVKSLPFTPERDIETKETFESTIILPFSFFAKESVAEMFRRELRQKRQAISKEKSTAK